MEKRSQIKKYFKPFPKWGVWAIVIGLPLLAVKGAGILPIAIGIWALLDWNKKPSDAQMDAWMEEDLAMLNQKALAKTGTDASEIVGDPVMVVGPRFWDISNAEVAFKKGKDGVLRFTPVGVSVLNLTENQVIAYECALDCITGSALSEGTDEYYFRDIVSVSTKTKSKNVQVPGTGLLQLNSAEIFELTTSGGTSIEVVLRDPNLVQYMGGSGEIPTTRAEKAIQTLRKMLREKKSSLAA